MKKNIHVFYVLAFLQGLVFYSSVSTLYRLHNGIDLKQMGIIEGCLSICMVLFEIPSGFLCDKIGYKKTMLLSNGLYFVSKILFWKAHNFITFLLEAIFLALALSGLSGCDSAMLYLSVDSSESAGVFGKLSMFGTLGMCVASIGYTLFFSHQFQAAAFATMIVYFLAFCITFLLTDVKEETIQKTKINSYKDCMGTLLKVLPLLIGSVLLTESTHTLTTFYNQLQYVRCHVPLSLYGIFYFFVQMVALCTGGLEKILDHVSKEKLSIGLFIGAGICIVCLLFCDSGYLSVALFSILMGIETMYFALLNVFENDAIIGLPRATTLSVFSLVSNACMGVSDVLFGYASSYSLSSAYLLAIFFVVSGLCLFIYWLKNKEKMVK